MSQTGGQVQSQKASRPGSKCLRSVSDQDSFTVISGKRKNKGSFLGKLRCYFVAIKDGFPRDESGCSCLKWTLQATVDELLMGKRALLKMDF